MPLSKYAPKKFCAIREFTDREEPVEIFKSKLSTYRENSQPYKILVYYGHGGLGKTSLIKKFKEIADKKNINTIWVDLAMQELSTQISPLITIRKHIKKVCPRFDYAFKNYCSMVSQVNFEENRNVIYSAPKSQDNENGIFVVCSSSDLF
ncbi:MAG: hypothetical protein JRJ49_06865 [Deltaproteobacteria bacterium]|nr:hypothetical protein [Deltaproteobacteria bacterium]